MKAIHWIFLLSGIFFISLLLLVLPRLSTFRNPVAEIYKDGVLIRTVDLNHTTETLTIPFKDEDQENVLEISDGGIQMTSANCPDQLCVHQGKIRTGGTPIVCLPHRLVVQIKNGHSTTDAISRQKAGVVC